MTASNPLRVRIQSVTVEYDGPAGREEKTFAKDGAARAFYVRMSVEGRNPTIRRAEAVRGH